MNIVRAVFGKLVFIKDLFLKQSLIKKVLIIGIIVAIGWFGVKPVIVGSQQQQVQYQTAQAEKGTLISNVTASGSVTSGGSATITTSVTGIVKELYVKNGDTVNQGDTIAILTLDQSSLQKQTAAWASYLSAQNSVNAAKSKMNSLQAALFTASEAFTNGAGTDNPTTSDPQYIIERAEWLQAEANYTQQAAIIRQAEVAMSSAWLSYAQTSGTITSPISGIVSNLTLNPSMSISGSSSTTSTNGTSTSTSTTLGSILLPEGKPQATINLSEIDVTKVAVGQKVTLTLDAFPDKTFTGKISSINTNGSVSSGVTTYPTTITFDTTVDTIYPNMAVNATIITDIKNNVILVPSGAVQTSDGASTVRVMRNSQATPVQVEVGGSNDTQTEILSGVNVGDTVITGQTGSTTTGSTGAATSPFGNTRGGFGGASAPGGGGQMFIQRR